VSPGSAAGAVGALLPLAAVDPEDGRIEALRRAPRGATAAELQVMFLTQLLRAMRRTVPEGDFLPRSPARTVYEGMFDRTLADALAARDPLGLVRALAEAPGLKIPDDPADTAVGNREAKSDRAQP